MKLDKIAFAALIGFIARRIGPLDNPDDVQALDDMIDFQVPTPEPFVVPSASCSDVDTLLSAFSQAGIGKKIEAIKAYRSLTGAYLKEAKEAIERYLPSSEYRTAKEIKK